MFFINVLKLHLLQKIKYDFGHFYLKINKIPKKLRLKLVF